MSKGADTRERWARHAAAVLIMFLGCACVAAMLVLMNAREHRSRGEKNPVTGNVVITPRKIEPPAQSRVVKRTRSHSQSRLRAPAPELAAALSSGSFAMEAEGELPQLNERQLLGEPQQDLRDLVMSEESVDVPPRPLEQSPPSYPPRARAKGIGGQVVLGLLIGSDGEVKKIKVLEAQPAGVFEEAALEAARRWRFEPARYRSRPVKVWARQVVRFNLS